MVFLVDNHLLTIIATFIHYYIIYSRMPIKSIQKYEIQMIIEYFILFFCFFCLKSRNYSVNFFVDSFGYVK